MQLNDRRGIGGRQCLLLIFFSVFIQVFRNCHRVVVNDVSFCSLHSIGFFDDLKPNVS